MSYENQFETLGIAASGGAITHDGDGRKIEQFPVSGVNEGDVCLLTVIANSGSGSAGFGTRGLNISAGTHSVFCVATQETTVNFDFEDVVGDVVSWELELVEFAV